VVPRKGSLLGFLISFTPHITCFIIRNFWFTIFFLFCTCFTVTSKTMAEKSQLFTWTSGGDSHCHCPKFHCHYYQRHQNMYPHITHTKYRSLSGHSYAKPWLPLKEFRQENREGMWMTGLFVTVLWF
jgi:hypothetical protein